MPNALQSILTSALLFAITLYRRLISPLLPSACRFHPTCSQYASDAIATYGPWRGTWLALRRVGKCHPFHPGGEDPVA